MYKEASKYKLYVPPRWDMLFPTLKAKRSKTNNVTRLNTKWGPINKSALHIGLWPEPKLEKLKRETEETIRPIHEKALHLFRISKSVEKVKKIASRNNKNVSSPVKPKNNRDLKEAVVWPFILNEIQTQVTQRPQNLKISPFNRPPKDFTVDNDKQNFA